MSAACKLGYVYEGVKKPRKSSRLKNDLQRLDEEESRPLLANEDAYEDVMDLEQDSHINRILAFLDEEECHMDEDIYEEENEKRQDSQINIKLDALDEEESYPLFRNLEGITTEEDLPNANSENEADVVRVKTKEDLYKLTTNTSFDTAYVKEAIHEVFYSILKDKTYSHEHEENLTRQVAEGIITKIIGSGKIDRKYKIIVQVTLIENTGVGLKSGAAFQWDVECDTCVAENFINESLLCLANVFGIQI